MNSLCSYLIFNTRHKNTYCYTLKVKRKGQLKGTIIMDDVPGWWTPSMLEFCKSDLIDNDNNKFWNKLSKDQKDDVQKNKLSLTRFIELIMIHENISIPFDIANTFSYIR